MGGRDWRSCGSGCDEGGGDGGCDGEFFGWGGMDGAPRTMVIVTRGKESIMVSFHSSSGQTVEDPGFGKEGREEMETWGDENVRGGGKMGIDESEEIGIWKNKKRKKAES